MSVKKPGRLAKRARVGEYVLATVWADCDPRDPWRVGFVCEIVDYWKPRVTRYVIGGEDGKRHDVRQFEYVRRITAEEGAEWIALYGKETVT